MKKGFGDVLESSTDAVLVSETAVEADKIFELLNWQANCWPNEMKTFYNCKYVKKIFEFYDTELNFKYNINLI